MILEETDEEEVINVPGGVRKSVLKSRTTLHNQALIVIL